MSYKCGLCHTPAKPGQRKLKHIVYRNKVKIIAGEEVAYNEIACEINVCEICKRKINDGTPYEQLAVPVDKYQPPYVEGEQVEPMVIKEVEEPKESEWVTVCEVTVYDKLAVRTKYPVNKPGPSGVGLL